MTVQPLHVHHDLLTRQTLATAAALLDAAARGDRGAMRQLLKQTAAASGCTHDLAVILREASMRFGVTVAQILAGQGFREAVDARHVTCYVGHLLGLGYSHMGRQLERDHSTVMSGCRRVKKDDRLRTIAEDIADRLRAQPLDAVSA